MSLTKPFWFVSTSLVEVFVKICIYVTLTVIWQPHQLSEGMQRMRLDLSDS